MIADTWQESVEYADKIKAMSRPAKQINGKRNVPEACHIEYLSSKLKEFCDKTGFSGSEIFKKSHKEYYVRIRVAFTYFVDNYSPVYIGKFLGYHYSTVYHWAKSHKSHMQKKDYRMIIEKLETKGE